MKTSQKSHMEIISQNEFGLVVKHETKSEKDDALSVLDSKVRRVRASSAKAICKTDSFLKMIGQKGYVDAQSQRRFDIGTMTEPLVVQWMEKDGCTVEHNSEDSIGIIIPVKGGIITGHHDVIYSHPLITGGERTLGDIKTMNDRSYKSWLAKGTKKDKPVYYAQVSIYAPVFNLQHGSIIATNKNDQTFSADFFPIDLDYRKELIEEIENNIAQEKFYIDPDGGRKIYFGKKTLCDYCSNRSNCDNAAANSHRGIVLRNHVPKLKDPKDIIDLLALLFDLSKDGSIIKPTKSLEEITQTTEYQDQDIQDENLQWNDLFNS